MRRIIYYNKCIFKIRIVTLNNNSLTLSYIFHGVRRQYFVMLVNIFSTIKNVPSEFSNDSTHMYILTQVHCLFHNDILYIPIRVTCTHQLIYITQDVTYHVEQRISSIIAIFRNKIHTVYACEMPSLEFNTNDVLGTYMHSNILSEIKSIYLFPNVRINRIVMQSIIAHALLLRTK